MRVVIVMDGGLVQQVLADKNGIEVMVLDYDVEGIDEDIHTLYEIPQGDVLDPSEATLANQIVETSQEWVDMIYKLHGEENTVRASTSAGIGSAVTSSKPLTSVESSCT